MANSNRWLCFAVIMGISAVTTNSVQFNSTATYEIGKKILEYMDKDVDPCDNFYKHVCGNFLKTAIVPNDRRTLSAQNEVMKKVKEQLMDMLKKPSLPNELRVFKFMKQFYNRCLDQNAIDKEGFNPVSKLLNRLGGWPALEGDHWNSETWSWNEFTYKCRENGISESYFLDLTIKSNPVDHTKLMLSIQSPHATDLAHEYDHADDEKYDSINSKYMVYIAKLMIGNKRKYFNKRRIEAAMAEVRQFTIDLMNISEPVRDDESPYKPMTLKDMITKWPSISWLDYFTKLLPANVKIDENEIINVVQPEYLTKFEKLIKKTPKRVQANFGIWHIFLDIMGLLPSQVLKKRIEQHELLGLPKPSIPRSEYCFGIMESFFFVGIKSLYIREYFKEDDEQSVAELVTEIKNQLLKTLENEIEWMDDITKTRSLEKASTITSFIALRDKLMDDRILENLYSSLKLDCDSFFQCYLNVFTYIVDSTLGELKQSVNENSWTEKMLKFEVDISYSPNNNRITIPAEILQDVFFERSRPKYVNYGVLGSIIGEKMLNSFDDIGRMYDKSGNLNELWTNYTKERFNNKSECLIHQYNNYSVTEVGMTLDGTYNVESNIIRHGGIKLAYLAYNNWVIKNGVETLLPQFNSTYTPKKLFWISLANANCVRMHPDYLKRYIKYGRLIPPEFQINGALSDMSEFSHDFNCPNGSKMSRINTCAVW